MFSICCNIVGSKRQGTRGSVKYAGNKYGLLLTRGGTVSAARFWIHYLRMVAEIPTDISELCVHRAHRCAMLQLCSTPNWKETHTPSSPTLSAAGRILAYEWISSYGGVVVEITIGFCVRLPPYFATFLSAHAPKPVLASFIFLALLYRAVKQDQI